jgi:hypothetical protein
MSLTASEPAEVAGRAAPTAQEPEPTGEVTA